MEGEAVLSNFTCSNGVTGFFLSCWLHIVERRSYRECFPSWQHFLAAIRLAPLARTLDLSTPQRACCSREQPARALCPRVLPVRGLCASQQAGYALPVC